MIWQLVIGLVLMLAGGEGLVRGAVAIASRLGVSPLVIGVTLIGFGTSAPELATCIDAVLVGAPGIAVGNVIGSNIANVLLILAIGALIYPITAEPRALRRDGSFLLLSALVCAAILMTGTVGRGIGAALLLALVGYLVLTALDDRRQCGKEPDTSDEAGAASSSLMVNLALVVFGLGGVLFGADLLVKGAVELAGRLGVSDAVIGLTVIAIGTSLPELSTAVIASMKRQGAIAFGNVIGSNIFNSLGILGATAVVLPIDVPAGVAGYDLLVMLGATIALLVFAATGHRINRVEGGLLLIGYVVYLGLHAGPVAA